MELTIVGCSPAWTNPGGADSGYLLEQSVRLLLDVTTEPKSKRPSDYSKGRSAPIHQECG